MEYKYEHIKLEEDLPIKIILHQSTGEPHFIPRHWHESIEISYVLRGIIDHIYIDGVDYTSKQGDIVLINSNSIHSFSVDKGDREAVTVFIPLEFIKANYHDTDPFAFDCISIFETDEKKAIQFNEIRKNLDSMIEVYKVKENDSLALIKIKELSFQLIYLLLKNFKVKKKGGGDINTDKYLDRLTKITDYMKENYKQNLSLDLIATTFNLSPSYLSRFFIKYMGMTVLDYINSIRIEKSYRDLVNTDHSIIQIALEHGFPNQKSFNRVFKTLYTVTPNQYRKENRILKSK
ncbi:AraC family transcriptional regulator [Neobacillus drentensis]|uniref:AraC family transcriptional regulator n=1 Tax=Neobacillus drentensis TaxID=220684 RepID=UPI002FFF72B2